MTSEADRAEGVETGLLTPRLLTLLSVTAVAYFVLRLVYFAIAVHHSAPPDEPTHFERVVYFSQFWCLPSGLPGDGESHLWSLRYHPPLYYLLAGKFLLLNMMSGDELLFVRFFNGLLSLMTVWYGWRFIKLTSTNPLVHVVFLVMITNTLMFSFLSAAVNYDNAVNLIAAASIYYLVRYFKFGTARDFLCLLVALLLGTLTKVTMLPFGFVAALAVLVHGRRNIRERAAELIQSVISGSYVLKGALMAVVLLIGLNGLLYGSNLLRFGHLVPSSDQVISPADLGAAAVESRNSIYEGFLRGELTLEEAKARAKEVKDPAASLDVLNLINYEAWRQENEGPFVPMSRIAYVVPWSKIMLYSTFGVLGHSVAFKSFSGHIPYLLIFGLAALSFLFQSLNRRVEATDYLLGAMFCFYVVVLMQLVNYATYVDYQLLHISVQGRYLFPFLVPVYALTARYLLTFGTARVQSAVAIAVVLVFIYGDFPFFLSTWGSGPW